MMSSHIKKIEEIKTMNKPTNILNKPLIHRPIELRTATLEEGVTLKSFINTDSGEFNKTSTVTISNHKAIDPYRELLPDAKSSPIAILGHKKGNKISTGLEITVKMSPSELMLKLEKRPEVDKKLVFQELMNSKGDANLNKLTKHEEYEPAKGSKATHRTDHEMHSNFKPPMYQNQIPTGRVADTGQIR